MQMTSRRGFLRAVGATAAAASAQQPSAARKAGYAVVGLGRLAQNQILPAFAKCRSSRVTALVSGDTAKAARLAAQYGVNPKNIYNYQTYDRLASNAEADIIYIVLPNGMHAEYTIQWRLHRKLAGGGSLMDIGIYGEAILNNTEVRTPGEEEWRDLKLMMAIYEAARTGRAVRVAG